jgi:hypothetical protein
MMMNNDIKLIASLVNVIKELDHEKVSWIDKHLVIDLNQKAEVLYESVTRLEADEKQHVVNAANEFLAEIKPVIEKLNNEKIGA